MYNPFKMHIVQNGNDRYYIRVMRVGWKYPSVWKFYSAVTYADTVGHTYTTMEEAQKAMTEIQNQIERTNHDNAIRKESKRIKKVIQ
jgi:uncharacterized protein YukE